MSRHLAYLFGSSSAVAEIRVMKSLSSAERREKKNLIKVQR